MTIIDSQIYIIDSVSLEVSLECNANLVVAWLHGLCSCSICLVSIHGAYVKSVDPDHEPSDQDIHL